MHLFTYGTLMNPKLMEQLLGVSYETKSFLLTNYQRTALRERQYPGLIYKKGQTTEGIIYLNIEPGDFEILDDYEGTEYERIEVDKDIQTYLYVGSPNMILNLPWRFTEMDKSKT
jgi:gamma-glutamylcyclotransferase (GGCT)/AIG2-like uncharacterized protein YtfP